MQKVTGKNKRFTKIEINLSNFAHNIRKLRSNLDSKNTKIMGIVKSNAYGHGVLEISKQAVKSGVWSLGVVLAEDGIKIRKAGLKCPLFILGEPPLEIVRDALKYDFILCLNSFKKAQAISDKCARFGKKIKVHLKVDTGMNRFGIDFREAVDEIEKITLLPSIKVEGIFTHFACAGDRDQSYTETQWKRFQDVLAAIEEKKLRFKIVHCANSAAFLQNKKYHLDMVRLGISMYGLSPFDIKADKWLSAETLNIVNNLKPVLTLKSKVSFVKNVPEGEHISYGSTFKTSRDSIIATIPIGYADGYTRLYSNKASVMINGGLAPITGNVTMDQLMVDVTDVPGRENITEGTEVVLIGDSNKKEISADYLSMLIGTINYEVLCMLKDKIPRSYIY